MSSVNKVILLGHLGRDPEVRYTQSGQCVATINLATSRKHKDKHSGELIEDTEWHRVIAWEKLGETAEKYLRKGHLVYFEGFLRTRKWTDKDHVERYTTEIVALQMQLMPNKDKDNGRAEDTGAQGQGPLPYPDRSGKPAPAPRAAPAARTGFDDMDDDIPF